MTWIDSFVKRCGGTYDYSGYSLATMEAIGVVGTIANLVSAAEALRKAGETLASAEVEASKLKHELEQSQEVLKTLRSVLGKVALEHKQSLAYRNEISLLKQRRQQYDRLLKTTEKKFERNIKSRWLCQKSECDQDSREARRYRSLPALSLKALQIQIHNSTHREVKDIQSRQINTETQGNIDQCMDWLFHQNGYETLFLPQYRKEVKDCEHSPGAWILAKEEYQLWQEDGIDKQKWLWATGDPGAGKSATAAWLGHRLKGLYFQPEDGIHNPSGFAMFFCDHTREDDIQTTNFVLKCLCRQLLEQIRHIEPT